MPKTSGGRKSITPIAQALVAQGFREPGPTRPLEAYESAMWPNGNMLGPSRHTQFPSSTVIDIHAACSQDGLDLPMGAGGDDS
jgi:hypothetical protein